jgi:Spy/CpxP family protein refolding chaperone
MKRYLKALLALGAAMLLIATVVAVANAQDAKLGQKAAQKRVLRSLIRPGAALRGLDLTQQQKDQIKAILASNKDAIKAAVTDSVKARLLMNRALASGASDQDLKAAFDNAANAQWNELQLRSKMIAGIKPILTPDQLARLQQRLQKVNARIQNLLKKKVG